MADVAQLQATLGLNPAPFIAGLRSAETRAALFSSSSQAALLGLGAVAVGVGAGLLAIGQMYEKADNKIAAATGATGSELDALGDNMRNVFTHTPASLDAVATAIVGVQQKLNLAGRPLEEMSLQFIRLSRITGTDLEGNIDSVSEAFRNWGVAAGDMPAKLDALYVASQQTGVSVADLASSLQAGGAAFRSLGIPIDEAAAMVANLSEEGVSSTRVIAGLNRAAVGFANGSAQATTGAQNLGEMVELVRNGTIGLNEVTEVFGARGAVTFYDAMRTGAIGAEQLAAMMDDSEGSIAEASAQVTTLSGKLTVLLHRAIANIEPVATAMLDALTEGLQRAIDLFDAMPDVVKKFLAGLVALSAAIVIAKAGIVAWSAASSIASGALGSLQLALTGVAIQLRLVAVAALANPLAAIAFVAAGAAAALVIFGSSSSQTAGDVGQLSQAIEEQTSLVGQNTEAWLSNTLMGQDRLEGGMEFVQAMRDAGLTLTDLNAALAEGGSTADTFWNNLVSGRDDFVADGGGGFRAIGADGATLINTFHDLGGSFTVAADQAATFNAVTAGGADDAEAMAQAVNDLVTEIQQYIAITQGVRQAQVAQREAQQSFYDSLLEAPKNFNMATAAGRANINMSDQYVASIASTVEALARQANSSQATGHEQAAMNRTIQGGIQQLRDAKAAGLITAAQYRRLADDMRGIPHDVPANVTSNVQEVLTLFQQLPAAIQAAASAADRHFQAARQGNPDAFAIPSTDEAFNVESMMAVTAPPISGRGQSPTAEAIGRAVARELEGTPLMTVDVGH